MLRSAIGPFLEATTINGYRFPGLRWEDADKSPGSRVIVSSSDTIVSNAAHATELDISGYSRK